MIKELYLMTPPWIMTIVIGIIVLVLVVLLINYLFTGREKPKTTNPKDDENTTPKPQAEPTKKKEGGKATFTDYLIFFAIVFAIAWVIVLYNIKKEPTTKRINIVVTVREVNKEDVWGLSWKRSPNVSITFPYKKPSDSFEIRFLKKDSKVMEFVSMTDGSPNGRVHAVLKAECPKVGRKWKGTYDNRKTGEAGFIGFDEVDDDNGGTMYVGEYSDGLTATTEWTPTVIKLKTK